MDIFKRTNVNMATKYDYQFKYNKNTRGRCNDTKMLHRYARRKLKASISCNDMGVYSMCTLDTGGVNNSGE